MTETSSPHPNRRAVDWIILPLALFPLVALLTYDWHAIAELSQPQRPSTNWIGALGDSFAFYGYSLVGLAIWIVPAACLIGGLLRFAGKHNGTKMRKCWFLATIITASALLQTMQNAPAVAKLLAVLNISDVGGAIGHLLMTRLLVPLLGVFGATIAMLVALALSLIAAIGMQNLVAGFSIVIKWALKGSAKGKDEDADDEESRKALSAGKPDISQQDLYLSALKAKTDAKHEREIAMQRLRANDAMRAPSAPATSPRKAEPPKAKPVKAAAAPVAKESNNGQPSAGTPYLLPSNSLLNPLKEAAADHSDIDEMSQRLIDTLKIFNIDATLSYTVPGPVVTKYAIELLPGTRYANVTGLADELMGSLHAKSIRIEAPIPGEDRVGIEVPNLKPAGISFREVFESDEWRNSTAELPLLFGKRADGKELVADLASMPHMLVAGATGQGKSVCLNSLICGLLMSRTPEQLKLIMVDPKSVEFTPYAAIPHLLVPVITDNRKVVFSLHWAVAEMEKRLKLFARAKVKNIYDFNHRPSFTQTDMFGNDTEVGGDMPKTVPYIVIIIDEAADLIGQCGKEVNPDIQRITQKARAAGIHLILATQRPDAKIITGTIKANIPGRVAFKTSQAIDSRTILDEAGAENLIGRGDMLFRGKDGLLIRAQGAWISDEEIGRITSFIEQHSQTQFDDKFAKNLDRVKETGIEDPFAALDSEGDNGGDEDRAAQREQVKAAENASDFKKAVECIINTNRASTSHFQRKLGWGYNHSAKIMDMLEEAGIIAPQSGAGPRQIIMGQDELIAVLRDEGDTISAPIAANTNAASEESAEPDLFDNTTQDSTANEGTSL